MFTADTYLEFGLSCTTLLDTHLHKLTYTFLIKHFEGIGLDDTVLLVELEE